MTFTVSFHPAHYPSARVRFSYRSPASDDLQKPIEIYGGTIEECLDLAEDYVNRKDIKLVFSDGPQDSPVYHSNVKEALVEIRNLKEHLQNHGYDFNAYKALCAIENILEGKR